MFSIGDELGRGWEDFKSHAGILIGAMIVTGLVMIVIQGVLSLVLGAAGAMGGMAGQAIGQLVLQLVSLVVQTFFTLGMIGIALKLIAGERAELGDLFGQGDKLIQGVIAQLVITLCSLVWFVPGALVMVLLQSYFVGIVLCVLALLPATVVWIFFTFTQWYVTDKDLDAVTALKASFQIALSSFLQLVLFGFVAFGLVLLTTPTCFLGMLVVGPLLVMTTGRIYTTLSAAMDAKAV